MRFLPRQYLQAFTDDNYIHQFTDFHIKFNTLQQVWRNIFYLLKRSMCNALSLISADFFFYQNATGCTNIFQRNKVDTSSQHGPGGSWWWHVDTRIQPSRSAWMLFHRGIILAVSLSWHVLRHYWGFCNVYGGKSSYFFWCYHVCHLPGFVTLIWHLKFCWLWNC